MTRRCPWGSDEQLLRYHDHEWGVPLHDDRSLFEFLILDCMQAGLSWLTILRRRDAYRSAFDDFDIEKVAAYDERKVASLLADPGIIRNRLKIHAAITNAKCVLDIQREFGSFDSFIWSFTGGRTIQNEWYDVRDTPTETEESRNMSDALRKRGMKFVGPTICYAFMQATGMVNDHVVECYRHDELRQ